ncbi:MAG: hypothetical protein L7W95_00785 [Alphaproteobacteria bacterium]|jgi:uncharacterized metal-binding protein YceD (DUF177 family)|nr:hypothetical protein [Alphaproteobacteria bacterium]
MQKMSLSTVIDVESLPFSGPQVCKIDCDESECTALAARFGFAAVARLSARLKVKRAGPGHWNVTGKLQAEVTQLCGVTGEPVPESVDFTIEERYCRASEEGTDIDVSLDGFEPLVDGAIDLGEVVAQTLAISVNPWPRSVDAPHSFAVGESEKEHPFAGLAALKSSD